MASSPLSPAAKRAWYAGAALAALAGAAWWFLDYRGTWPRGEALGDALRPLIDGNDAQRALVARAIWTNYLETRANATRWSGIYWGFSFAAASLSAAAALVLKLETLIGNDGLKKDVAATFSILAALLVTISTSGDFQRKWQANRVAAAELERVGYQLLENDGADARGYLGPVGQILLARQMAIVGGSDVKRPVAPAGSPSAPGR